jgi:hypothetical protein
VGGESDTLLVGRGLRATLSVLRLADLTRVVLSFWALGATGELALQANTGVYMADEKKRPTKSLQELREDKADSEMPEVLPGAKTPSLQPAPNWDEVHADPLLADVTEFLGSHVERLAFFVRVLAETGIQKNEALIDLKKRVRALERRLAMQGKEAINGG